MAVAVKPIADSLLHIQGQVEGPYEEDASWGARKQRREQKHAKGQRKAWLLVSNLDERSTTTERVVALYHSRMQIEEDFRDLKAPRVGFALRENLGRNGECTADLLLNWCARHTRCVARWLARLREESAPRPAGEHDDSATRSVGGIRRAAIARTGCSAQLDRLAGSTAYPAPQHRCSGGNLREYLVGILQCQISCYQWLTRDALWITRGWRGLVLGDPV